VTKKTLYLKEEQKNRVSRRNPARSICCKSPKISGEMGQNKHHPGTGHHRSKNQPSNVGKDNPGYHYRERWCTVLLHAGNGYGMQPTVWVNTVESLVHRFPIFPISKHNWTTARAGTGWANSFHGHYNCQLWTIGISTRALKSTQNGRKPTWEARTIWTRLGRARRRLMQTGRARSWRERPAGREDCNPAPPASNLSPRTQERADEPHGRRSRSSTVDLPSRDVRKVTCEAVPNPGWTKSERTSGSSRHSLRLSRASLFTSG